MSLPLFYLDRQILSDEDRLVFPLELNDEDRHHMHVLRLHAGEHIAIVDASHDYFECELVDESHVRIARSEAGDAEMCAHVTLVQGLPKGSKMDSVVRHATELGVDRFIPLMCERSIVRLSADKASSRVRRWNAIAKSAAMQAGRRTIPKVTDVLSVADTVAALSDMSAVAICWEESSGSGLCEFVRDTLSAEHIDPNQASVAIVIGPEGGLTAKEVAALDECSAHTASVTLGSTILRTETAGIVASALVIHELGGLR